MRIDDLRRLRLWASSAISIRNSAAASPGMESPDWSMPGSKCTDISGVTGVANASGSGFDGVVVAAPSVMARALASVAESCGCSAVGSGAVFCRCRSLSDFCFLRTLLPSNYIITCVS